MAMRSQTGASTAEQMRANIESFAATRGQTSTNVNYVAGSVEEMRATVKEIAENSEPARSMTVTAVTRAQNAAEKADHLNVRAVDL
jgi:methyl-accepting chemotaxis protein